MGLDSVPLAMSDVVSETFCKFCFLLRCNIVYIGS